MEVTEAQQGNADPAKKSTKALRVAKVVFNFILANWLLIGFGLACVLGYLFPHVAAHGGIIRSEYSILYGAIGLIFFINGMQLSQQKLKTHLKNWRLHLTVQGTNLVLIPIFQLVLVRIIIAAGGVSSGAIDKSVLIGMTVVGAIPTTIASNVVMTRNSGGDEAAAIIEVAIGNVFGAFLSPWLIYGFLPSDPEFQSWQPAPPNNLGPMYASVMMQLGLSVLLPLALGQLVRWLWQKQVVWALQKLYLGKLNGLFLVLVAWSTFSGAFDTGALYDLSKSSVVFNVLMNVAEYLVFTVLCFYLAYPPRRVVRWINRYGADSSLGRRLPPKIRSIITVRRMSRTEVVAVCFCGAAKTTSLGIPLTSAMWSQRDNLTIAFIQIPVLLFTTEQVFIAQFLTIPFKKWIEKEQQKLPDEESPELEQGPDQKGPAPDPAANETNLGEGGPLRIGEDPEKRNI